MKATKIISGILAAVVVAVSSLTVNVNAANNASIRKVNVAVAPNLNTESYSLYYDNGWYHRNQWNWINVSPISDFINPKGNYCIAYANGGSIVINTFDNNLKVVNTISFKKPMPLIGGVTCDASGNYYVACGQNDKAGKGNIVTFAIYKYSSAGKLLAKSERLATDPIWDARYPFDAGNCAMTFDGDVLVCNYACEMYSTHQANAVYAVNTKTMVRDTTYDAYASHSFNEYVITMADGTVAFANHGDAYPRSVQITFSRKNGKKMRLMAEYEPIHLAGDKGENFTNCKLCGIGEVNTGLAICGSLGEMNQSYNGQEMFIKIINTSGKSVITNGATRSGNSAGHSYTDDGIKWLTAYNGRYLVGSSAMVPISKDKILVMWEKCTVDGNFIDSYYSVVSSTGRIITSTVSMNGAHINGAEELKYNNGFVFWTYSNGSGIAEVYRMNVSGL